MKSAQNVPNMAVLIDADNTSADIADGLFDEIAQIGAAGVRRIYGDFTSTRSKKWNDILALHALVPQQQFAYTKGKNASDITLVIDAMDLLHKGGIDAVCLVSSDSDFTRLAQRIREEGIDVYGFGEQKTPESFRMACTQFFYTENLHERIEQEKNAAAPSQKGIHPPSKAVPILLKAVRQANSDDGWVHLGEVGSLVHRKVADFHSRNYGREKLSELVKDCGAFEVKKDSGSTLIRIKPTTKQAH